MSSAATASSLIIMGVGGHGRVCAEIAAAANTYAEILFSDPAHPVGTRIGEWTVAFHDEDVAGLDRSRYHLLLGIGQVAAAGIRRRLFARFVENGFSFATLIAPSAYHSPTATVGPGTVVGHHAVLNSGAGIGKNCIVNTHALIEHDATIGDHVHVATGAIVNGECSVGDRSLIGSGAVLRQGISVCADAVVGAGAVVVSDITVPGTYVGAPARSISYG